MPRCLILSGLPSSSRTRARRTRSAARMSTARVLPAERAPARRSASPAGSAENAACVMLCAALEITAKTVSSLGPYLTRTVPPLLTCRWEKTFSALQMRRRHPQMGIQCASFSSNIIARVYFRGEKSTGLGAPYLPLCSSII